VDKTYPLPQDPAKAKQLREARVAAVKKATTEVFAAGKSAKAPWADAAKKAMDAYAVRYARKDFGQRGVEYQDFLAAAAAAVEAGCDDPLVRYWHGRFVRLNNPDTGWDPPVAPADRAAVFRDVVKRLPETPYPASIRVHLAWNSYLELDRAERDKAGTLRPGEVAAAEAVFWKVFAELAAAPDRLSRETAADISHLVSDHYRRRGDGREAGWKAVDKVFAAAKTADWVRLMVEAEFLIQWGWDARGPGLGPTVAPEGARLLRERLTAAGERLQKAWDAEPTYPLSAARMITVGMGLGLGRDDMEKWFRRAMEADPDCVDACRLKLDWLKPRWHGTQQDLSAFIYQCYRTGNGYAGLPLLADGGLTVGGAAQLTGREWTAYYRQPEMWSLTRAVYEWWLKEYPGDRWVRTRYAILAIASDQPAEAARQFDALKDRPWTFQFDNAKQYEALRDLAKAAPPGKEK
jgi:hypothetical protein